MCMRSPDKRCRISSQLISHKRANQHHQYGHPCRRQRHASFPFFTLVTADLPYEFTEVALRLDAGITSTAFSLCTSKHCPSCILSHQYILCQHASRTLAQRTYARLRGTLETTLVLALAITPRALALRHTH